MNLLPFFPERVSAEEKQERSLIRAAQDGDRLAFDALARVYAPVLRGFLLRRVGAEAADDVLQETLLAGWTALPNYTRRAQFKTWFFAIAAHKCTDHYRRRGRNAREVPLQAAEVLSGGQEDGYAAVEWKQAIGSALAQLPDEQREVVELYYYAELSLREVADALERNLNTVKYQFYRAHTLVERELSAAVAPVERNEQRKVRTLP